MGIFGTPSMSVPPPPPLPPAAPPPTIASSQVQAVGQAARSRAALAAGIILVTSAILKFTWYDHLSVREVETDKAAANDN